MGRSNQLGYELCEWLGIDPAQVHKVTLEVETGRLPRLTVERWVPETGFVETLQSEYQIVGN